MRNTGIQVRVSDLLFALQKRWKMIVSLTFIGLIFGLMIAAMTYVQSSFQSFEVKGSYAISTKNVNGNYVNNAPAASQNDFHLAEDMIPAVAYILRSDRMLNEVIEKNKLLGYTPAQLRSAITITQFDETQIMEMTVRWANAEEGMNLWNDLVDSANELIPATLQLGHLEIINRPESKLVGVGGSNNSIWMALTVLGFAAGVGIAVMELLMHPTLNNVKDAETMFGLETIGIIPHDREYFKRRTSILIANNEGGTAEIVQDYAAAAYILRNRLGTREKHQCFYVTSATTQEGKTTVAANLAIQLSDMEHRTLLVDFDTRNPSLGSLFLENVDYNHSLNALYRGEVTEAEAITTLTGYLDLLPMVLEHNSLTLDNAIIDVLQCLTEKYEYVIIDAPPVGIVSDTLSLNQVASTVLFVIGYDKSTIPEIQSSLEKLDKSGIRVLGCVVNNVQSNRNLREGGKDGGRKKRRDKKRDKSKEEQAAFGVKTEKKDELDNQMAEQPPVKIPSARERRKAEKEKRKARKGHETTAAPSGNAPKRAEGSLLDELLPDEDENAPRSDSETHELLLRIGMNETPDGKSSDK